MFARFKLEIGPGFGYVQMRKLERRRQRATLTGDAPVGGDQFERETGLATQLQDNALPHDAQPLADAVRVRVPQPPKP